jgi:hypothetical protein
MGITPPYNSSPGGAPPKNKEVPKLQWKDITATSAAGAGIGCALGLVDPRPFLGCQF